MSGRIRGGGPAPGRIVFGIVRLAAGHADGLGQFGTTREAFLASLAPLVAFPLVGGALLLLAGGGLAALADLLATLCALMAPPVLSFEIARLWDREAAWLRFATAFNWCQWVIPLIASFLLLGVGTLIRLGLPSEIGRTGAMIGLVSYGLWLHCFLARHGLSLSWPRAGLMVFGVNIATVVIVLGPTLLVLAVSGESLGAG